MYAPLLGNSPIRWNNTRETVVHHLDSIDTIMVHEGVLRHEGSNMRSLKKH